MKSFGWKTIEVYVFACCIESLGMIFRLFLLDWSINSMLIAVMGYSRALTK